MKIGIDLDETVAELLEELIIHYHAKTGKLIPKEKIHTYSLDKIWNCSREEAINIVHEFQDSEKFNELKPVEYSIEGIKELSKKHELFIITARAKKYEPQTQNWLKKHLQENIQVIYSGNIHKTNGKSKGEICKEIGIQIMLEDHADYAIECSEKGVTVILFDKPWNKKVDSTNKIIKVESWKEAVKEIKKLAEI